MRCEITNDGRQRSDTERLVVGNRYAVLPAAIASEAYVAAGLARYRVAQPAEQPRKLPAGKIAREPQSAIRS